ncbi:MAG: PVC-type heme-binding CxxCH protein [Pirellula sp.]|jgi:putative membrane-bound dehydrogenase-like protein
MKMKLPHAELRFTIVSESCVRQSFTRPFGVILGALLIAIVLGAGQGGQYSFAISPGDDQFASELPRIEPLTPAESLKKFTLKPGYALELVAHEPDIADPVAIAFDEKSRMYVVEMIDYSEQSEERLGTIKLLEDKDGDGFYETSVRFATGLSWPTAVACYDQGVFVGAAPDILYLKDTDGDGIADINRKVFTGFGRGNVQGLVNSFRWGLDNRIYGQTSVSGGLVVTSSRPDDEPLNLSGKDFSFDPKKLDIRTECGGGQHGMSFDDYGNRFTCHNSDNLQAFLYEQRYEQTKQLVPLPPSRRSIAVDGAQASVFRTSPVEPWRILRTNLRVSGVAPGLLEGGGRPSGYFTSATGVTIYNGNQMPDLYGQAFIADVGSNLVHRKCLSRDGVGWKGERIDIESEFIASSDTWFRPVQFANAPDGCLYILDFYREVIEHPQSLPAAIKRHLDLTNGRDKGRIYRLRDARQSVQYRPDLSSYSMRQLMETLSHPNGWHRETARRLAWQKRSNQPDSFEIQSFWHELEAAPTQRHMNLSGQGRAGGLDRLALLVQSQKTPRDLEFWLGHQDPNVRATAIRLLEPLALQNPELRKKLYRLSTDIDIGVRFQLALTMSLLPQEDTNEADRRDAIQHLLNQMTSDSAYRASVMNLIDSNAVAMMKERLEKWGSITEAGQGGNIPPSNGPPAGPTYEVLGYCFASVASTDDLKEFDRAWGRIVGVNHTALDLGKESTYNDMAMLLLRGVLDGLDAKRGFTAKSLREYPMLNASVSQLVTNAISYLENIKHPPEARLQAIRTLRWASDSDAAESYYALLSPVHPVEIQEKAMEGLSRFHDTTTATGILARYRAFTPSMRGRTIDLLMRRSTWLDELLNHLEQGQVDWSDFSTSQRTALRTHSNQKVRERVARYFESSSTDRSKIIAEYQKALSLPGDVATGKGLFVKLCSSCHKADGVGYELGPNLVAFRYRGPEAILQNVLDPNREVNPMYLSYNVMTDDETTVSGMIESESIEVLNLTRGGEYRDAVLRSKIAEMKSSRVSIMPEGFENQLDHQAMADLLAYLMQLR